MQKTKRILLRLLILCLLMLVFVWWFFVDMSHLPEGTLMGAYISPDGEYVVNTYLCSGNATVADSVRCEVVYNGKKRNIYWQYKEFRAKCTWISENTIDINGIILDVETEAYDWRWN